MMNATLTRCFGAMLLCAVMVGLSIAFVDRPAAQFVATHRGGLRVFQVMCAPSLLPLPFACVYLTLCALRRAGGGVVASPVLFSVSIATIAATAAKDELKYMFGRPWPEYYIKYGVYAFHPFDTGFLYGGFPSGHTAYIAAPMLVLCWAVPRLAALWAGLIVLVMAGLVGGGYHFVGDVIGGFFLGLAAAAGTVMWLRPRYG